MLGAKGSTNDDACMLEAEGSINGVSVFGTAVSTVGIY